MLSTGTASASSGENRSLRGLRTRAFPVGVTVLRATELVKRININEKYPTMIEVRPLTKMKNRASNSAFPRSSPDTSRLLREDRPGETPQRDSARRLAGRPRKARGVWTADLKKKVGLTLNESGQQFIFCRFQ